MRQRLTWNEKIIKTIKDAQKPLQLKEIHYELMGMEKGIVPNYDSIRVYVCNLVRDSKLVRLYLKPEAYGFYCNPEWVDDKGQLKFIFNPTFDKKSLE